MRVKPASPTAVTIGNFDGVHLGHAALVRAAREAVFLDGRVVAMCFDPHPLATLRPGSEPPRLSTFEQRTEWLRALGADEVETLTPTSDFLAQRPEEFIEWLMQTYQPSAIVEGPDFRFGRGRAGSIDTLQSAGASRGFETIVVEPVDAALSDQSIVRASSSMVRWLLGHGRVRDARQVLDRPYEIRANVVRGDQRGRSLGVPTANLDHGEMLLPADGIYAGCATAPDGSRHPAAISVGTKPTFGKHPRICEAHLVDYRGEPDTYGWTMRVEFHEWIRDQLRYSDLDALIEQLRRDIAVARERKVCP